MRADEYLAQVRILDVRINNKIKEMQRVMDLATKITASMSGMPRPSGVSDKVGEAAVRLSHLSAELDRITDELIDTRADVVKLIETLPPDEYAVLHAVYVQGQTVEEVADAWIPGPRTPRQIYRIKARAMRRVQSILDVCEAEGISKQGQNFL